MTVTTNDLTGFVAKLTAFVQSTQGYEKASFAINKGSKYAKLVVDYYASGSGSAYCFVDLATGDLLKPDGWKKPAKGVRGNIFAANPLAGCTPYGMVYFK